MGKSSFKRLLAVACAALSLLCVCACGKDYEYEYFEKNAFVFDGVMPFYARLLGKNAPAAYDEMIGALNLLGSEISLTDENSTLSYFNNSAVVGEKVELSKRAYELVELALVCEEETDGAFSIGAYNLSKLWGVDANGYISDYDPFEGALINAALPDCDTVLEVKAHCDTANLVLSEADGKFYIEKSDGELAIDLGGIAKGYCADMCVEIMKKYSVKSALINIAGNIVLLGGYYDGKKFTDWEIAVINPRPKFNPLREQVCVFKTAGDVSVVTSGDYMRYYRHESGLELCHIIDPTRGLPIDIEALQGGGYIKKEEVVSSVTVLSSSSARADAYSTAVAVMGIEKGYGFIGGISGVDALIFTEKGVSADEEVRGRMAATGGINFIYEDTIGGFKRYTAYA